MQSGTYVCGLMYSSRALVFVLGCFYTKITTFQRIIKKSHCSGPLELVSTLEVKLRLSKTSNSHNII